MLPPNRQLKKLGDKDIVEIIDGDRGSQYPKKEEFMTDGYCLFLNTSNVRYGFFDFSKKDFISKERDELLRKGKIQEGDIILTTRGTIGNCAYFKNTGYENARINSGMVILRVNTTKLDPEFLQKIIISPLFINQTNKLSSGSAQPQLPIGTINKIEIPLPPLPTQHKIVAALDEASAQIIASKSAIQSQLDALDQLWQSSLSEVFEKGGGISKTINDISHKIQYGYTGKTIEKGQFRYLRITDIQNDNVNWETVPFVDVLPEEAKKYELNTGDVVFARTGATVGKSFLINEVGKGKIFASYLIRVVPNYEHIKPEFLKYFFQSGIYWSQIFADVVGAAQPNFNGKKLGEILIPLPDLATQTRIVAQLDDLSQNIASLRSQYTAQLKHFDDLRASMLDQAFRGELVEE